MTPKEKIKKFIPKFLLEIYHFCWALFGALVFGFPGYNKKIKIIGVTGTSGKSTTVDFITRILEEAGNNVASISSIRFKIGEKEWENKYKMTMPGRFVIQKFLRQAKDAKCQFVVLEVTSEGIKQFRHKFINFDTAVFTNLSPEHIESHGSFENYRNAKLKLFQENKNTHVVNIADKNAEYFWDIEAEKKIGFKIKNQKFHPPQKFVGGKKIKDTDQKSKIIEIENVESIGSGVSFKIQDTKFQIPLIGEFNIMNALAATAAAKNYGVSFEVSKKTLEKVEGMPGRMEIIQKEPFLVVVDYAHTPEQLESVYKTLKNLTPNTQHLTLKLVCVLGSCGGGRDKWKRPVLGKIASDYCDEIIVTNEDPYDEEPMKIIEEVASGAENISMDPFNQHKSVSKILDRKQAIKKALKDAQPGDTVIITGKGSEPWMCVENGKKIPWDDRATARDEMEKLKIHLAP